MSRRLQILEVIRDRLALITIAGGFNTDAGATVLLGEVPTLGEDDPEVAIAITVDDDQRKFQGENIFLDLPIEIHALAKADLDEPHVIVEQVLEDIKKAIELPDRTLGRLVKSQIQRGQTKTQPRETGSTTVGVSITYIAPYTELWGQP